MTQEELKNLEEVLNHIDGLNDITQIENVGMYTFREMVKCPGNDEIGLQVVKKCQERIRTLMIIQNVEFHPFVEMDFDNHLEEMKVAMGLSIVMAPLIEAMAHLIDDMSNEEQKDKPNLDICLN